MAAVESREQSENLAAYRADSSAACFARVGLGLSKAQVPDRVWHYLKCCVADAIGIAYASHHYDFSERTRLKATFGSFFVIFRSFQTLEREGKKFVYLCFFKASAFQARVKQDNLLREVA